VCVCVSCACVVFISVYHIDIYIYIYSSVGHREIECTWNCLLGARNLSKPARVHRIHTP